MPVSVCIAHHPFHSTNGTRQSPAVTGHCQHRHKVCSRGARQAAWQGDDEARRAGFDPRTIQITAGDHNAYYPQSHPIHVRLTGDRDTGRLLGVQLLGHRHAEIAKRIDTAATALFYEAAVS
jgi:NADPH-dependent 2,4-dienoyl-CoA reductase/sulfur reductase-like enzyme